MKRKLITILVITLLLSASALYGQTSGISSFYNRNTMTIFKGDVDKLVDVNDFGEVEINKASIFTGARYDAAGNRLGGVMAGFSKNLGKLHLGLLYDGRFWDGTSEKVFISGTRKDSIPAGDTGFIFDNNFSVLIGNETIGGLGFNIDFDNLQTNKDETKDPNQTLTVKSGYLGLGAVWGKNFGVGQGALKPELGFFIDFNLARTKSDPGGGDQKGPNGHSILAFILTSEYVFAKEGSHQTTLSFGDYPLIYLAYKDKEPSHNYDGAFFNTLFFEFKQVYDLSGSLSAGYLAGLSFVTNSPNKDDFDFGFFPRVSTGLAYKTSEKFTFNTGLRLGSLRPEPVQANWGNNFGIHYNKSKQPGNVEIKTTSFLPFVGAWGIGLLWQPEKIFNADFGVDCELNSGGANLNFNVLFSLFF